MAEDYCP
jgi:hypothetical protein